MNDHHRGPVAPQPPPAYGPPPYEPGWRRRRRTGPIVAITVVALLVAVGAVLGVVLAGGDDGADPDSATDAPATDQALDASSTGLSGAELTATVMAAGYSCDPSLAEPDVRRCFDSKQVRDGSDPSSVLTTIGVQTDSSDVVEGLYVGAESESFDAAAEVAAARTAWRLVGPDLLGAAADPLTGRFGTDADVALDWGAATFRSAPTSVFVAAHGRAAPAVPPMGLGQSVADLTSMLEGGGFSCDAVPMCDRGDGYSVMLFPAGDDTRALSLSAYNPALYTTGGDRPGTIRAELASLAESLGVGGPELAALLDEGFAAGDRVRVGADIDGMHYSFVVWWVSPGSVFKADLAVEPISWA